MSIDSQAPGWEWYFVAMYFFVGGVSAGAYFIGSLIELFGGDARREISRVAFYVAFPVILLAPPLLIADLGRPERFWHLFFYVNGGVPYINLQSPLSVGSWALLLFGGMSFLSFVDNLVVEGRFKFAPFAAVYNRVPRRLYALVGSLAGFFVASYTGVLVEITARPLWVATDPLIGALFIASAGSCGAAAIYLVLAARRALTRYHLREFELLDRIAMVLELVLIAAMIALAGRFAAPLTSGTLAILFWGGAVVVGTLLPLAINWFGSRGDHPLSRSSALVGVMAVLVLFGGALLRIILVTAGQV
jgi:formate-dependent nitrite reductase membrane component NrfD